MIMKVIRNWLVRNFVLGTWIKVFGKKMHTLRAPRVLWPMFIFGALIIMGTEPWNYSFEWWNSIIYFIWAVGIWLGFDFFSWSYFKLHTVKYKELDDEQKYDFLRAIKLGVVKNPEQDNKYGFLFGWQLEEHKRLENLHNEKYKGKFAGLKNLIPLGTTILGILIWYIFIV